MTSAPPKKTTKEVLNMYTKDKTNRITLRLNDEQFEYVRASAEPLGVSPSEFLRMVINATMSATKQASANLSRVNKAIEREFQQIQSEEDNRRENEIAVQYDQL